MILKLFFSGSSDFSLNFFKIIEKYINSSFLFLSSDFSLNFNILKIFCLKKNFFFLQFKNIFFYNKFLFYNIYYFIKFKKFNFNISIVFDYGFIFSILLIRIPFYGFFNIHLSSVFFFKGCNPLKMCLFYNIFFTGVSLIFINKFFDLGNIFYFLKINLLININYIFIKKFIIYHLYHYIINFLIKIFKKKLYFNFKQLKNFNFYNSQKIK